MFVLVSVVVTLALLDGWVAGSVKRGLGVAWAILG